MSDRLWMLVIGVATVFLGVGWFLDRKAWRVERAMLLAANHGLLHGGADCDGSCRPEEWGPYRDHA